MALQDQRDGPTPDTPAEAPYLPAARLLVLYAATKHTATQDFQVGRELALRKQVKRMTRRARRRRSSSPYKDGVWTHTTFRQSLKVKVKREVELAKQYDVQGREVSSRCQS